jgi:hypothetical protein
LTPGATIALLGFVLYGVYRLARGGGDRGLGAWRQTGTALGLELTVKQGHATLRGSSDGIHVEATTYAGSPLAQGSVYITITGVEAPHAGVRLSRQPFANAPGSTELQLGDFGFDRRVYLEGTDVAVAAMLTTTARSSMRELMRRATVVVDGGHVELTYPGYPTGPELIELIEMGRQLFVDLSLRGQTVAERLLDNAREDEVDAVRETNLRLLLEVFPETEAGQRGVELALGHRSARLRMLGAAALPEGAAEALGAMLRDKRMTDQERAEVLPLSTKLGSAFHPELKLALAATDEVLQARIVDHIAELGAREFLPELRQQAVHARGEGCGAFCRAFVALDDREAEPLLLQLLAGSDLAGRVQAAHALAKLGTVRAVAPLLEISSALLTPIQLKSAARKAIGAIQARLGEADVGDVSLVAPANGEGELSLAEQPGELTVVDR